MTYADYVLSITSTLFRLTAFIFLRIIPSPICKAILPILFITYAALLFITSESARRPRQVPEKKTVPHGNRRPTSRPSSLICAFALSLPSPYGPLRKVSLFVNAIILLFVADFVTHPVRYPAFDTIFTRVGAVDHSSAKLTLRYPGNSSSDMFHVKVLFRPLGNDPSRVAGWKEGPVVELSEQNDWVGTTIVAGLWPRTTYEYKLAFPNSSNAHPYPPAPLRFETFPDPRLATGSHFKFIASSCILPNFPYIPGKGYRIKGFDLMVEQLFPEQTLDGISNYTADSNLHSLESSFSNVSLPIGRNHSSSNRAYLTKFLLLLGDFIYADVPTYYGDSEVAYRRLYRRTYASPSYRKIYERLPTLHIYDDHEIINNFAGLDNESTPPFPNASRAFNLYNGDGNYDPRQKGQYYYDFHYGDVAYFVLDTRRYRSNASEPSETMLGAQQLEVLQSWLAEVNRTSTFKFIVSSVPFTSLWQHDAQIDSWAAYRRERDGLLDILHTVPNVFILSGDRHEFAAVEFNGPHDWSHPVYEFSTSPLSMFYIPFVRTLKMESSELVERTRTILRGDGQMSLQEKYRLPKERVVKYLPIGNYKWTSFEINTRNASAPTITADVVINGQLAFRWHTVGSPTPSRRSTSLSQFVPGSLHAVLGKFGLEYRNWF